MILTPRRAYIINWKEINRWIIPPHLILSSHLPDGWSFVRVGEIVRQVTSRVRVNPNKEYKMLGVKWYGEGTFHRETVRGIALSANYVTPAVTDAFIYNRLFAWKGSFAVVPEEHSNCFVSNEFPQFIVDEERILPRYLYLFFMSDNTTKAVNKASIGSAAVSRNRFKEDDFLSFLIPLPPLSIQQSIVTRWQHTQKEIKVKRNRADIHALEIENELLHAIGVRVLPATPRKGAFSLRWRELERWDTFFHRSDFVDLENQLSRIQSVPLGELLNFISRPWKKADFPNGTFEYIEISSVTKQQGIIGSKTVDVKNPPSRATTLIKAGDIILAMTRPYLGAFAIVPDKYDGCICSSGFALADGLKSNEVDKNFILFFLKSTAGLKQMERRMTGGLYPAIVQSELEKVKVPLPPLNIQREIVQHVEEGNVVIEHERDAAIRLANEIKNEVEELILGTKKIVEM